MADGSEIVGGYREALGLAEAMLEAANRSEWERLRELEGSRRARIDALMDLREMGLREEESAEIGAHIRRILEIDEKVKELAGRRMEELKDRLEQAKKGKAGAEAYGSLKD